MKTKRKFSRMLIFLMAWCAMGARGDTIGFLYALDADLRGLKFVACEVGQSTKVGSRQIQRLQLGAHTIFAVKMGSGAVETAASAQALLARYKCDWVFSLGPAGALTENVKVGSWYRVSQVLAWQHGNSAAWDLTEVPIWKTKWSRFPAINFPPIFRNLFSVSVASGEQFISTTSERERVQVLTRADVVDMNSFGISWVCADHGVPLFSWKIISDLADEKAAEHFRDFISSYTGEGGKALAEIIQMLPANPNEPLSYPAIGAVLKTILSTSEFSVETSTANSHQGE